MTEILLFFDGASRGNPGESGAGWFISSSDKQYNKKGFIYLGIKTNNQAEYLALLHALQVIKQDFPDLEKVKLHIKGDSQLVIKQLNGEFKVKNSALRESFSEIQTILSKMKSNSFTWIPRMANKIADELANHAIDHILNKQNT